MKTDEARRSAQKELLNEITRGVDIAIKVHPSIAHDIRSEQSVYGDITKICIDTMDGKLKASNSLEPFQAFEIFKPGIYDKVQAFVATRDFQEQEFSYLMSEVGQRCFDFARGRHLNPFEEYPF